MELAAAEAELEAGPAEERLRVAVEAAGSEMRVVCRGHCDIDKVQGSIVQMCIHVHNSIKSIFIFSGDRPMLNTGEGRQEAWTR